MFCGKLEVYFVIRRVLIYPKGYDSEDLAAFFAIADPAKFYMGGVDKPVLAYL